MSIVEKLSIILVGIEALFLLAMFRPRPERRTSSSSMPSPWESHHWIVLYVAHFEKADRTLVISGTAKLRWSDDSVNGLIQRASPRLSRSLRYSPGVVPVQPLNARKKRIAILVTKKERDLWRRGGGVRKIVTRQCQSCGVQYLLTARRFLA